MSYLTQNVLKKINDYTVYLENYQIHLDAYFRTDFEEWPEEKITALALLADVLNEAEINCELNQVFESAEAVIDSMEDERNEVVNEVKIIEIKNETFFNEGLIPKNHSDKDFKNGKVNDLPKITFQISLQNNQLLQGIPKVITASSVSDTGMEMY